MAGIPVVADLPRELEDGQRIQPPYFFGAYAEAELASLALHDAFASRGWLTHCRTYAKAIGLEGGALAEVRRRVRGRLRDLRAVRALFPRHELSPHLRIPYERLCSLLGNGRRDRVSVLDLGGGFGDNFHALDAALGPARARRLDYTVVDNAKSCELGEALFAKRSVRPVFSTTIPAQTFDLVLVIGTLQYVLAWRDFCATILGHCGTYLYVARSPIVMSHPTFCSLQSICPAMGESALRQVGVSPVVVISRADLTSFMEQRAWRLVQEAPASDYSSNFSRLPGPRRAVVYVDLLWGAPRPGASARG